MRGISIFASFVKHSQQIVCLFYYLKESVRSEIATHFRRSTFTDNVMIFPSIYYYTNTPAMMINKGVSNVFSGILRVGLK